MSDETTLNLAVRGYDLSRPIDISISLHFNGPQPNAYGVDPASSKACQAGDIVGDTRRGGSVNFEQYTLIPHCNGTHTECIGHITDDRISVLDCLQDVFAAAVLVSVEPENSGEGLVISREALSRAVGRIECVSSAEVPGALIVRTLPNDESKLSRSYGSENIPPYFSTEAMEYIVESGVRHLLVDLPSIDRIFDDGKLINHRMFWNVAAGSRETHSASRIYCTITELIYVPNEVADGKYLLNLQIAPFASDAAPSRPVLFKAEPPA